MSNGFNPRTREGCDARCELPLPLGTRFNPRTREGCDSKVPSPVPCWFAFQSTHPRGVRHNGSLWYFR